MSPLAATKQGEGATETQPVRGPSEAECGRLGRKPQFDAVRDVVTDLALQPTVPSCALLVSGHEDAGHRFFLRQLLQTPTLLRGRPTSLGRPLHDQYDVSVLIPWVAQRLGLTEPGPVLTLQDLAERVAAELMRQPLGLVLDQIHRLAGGVFAFQQHFWLPLFAHLQESRARFPKSHRLVAIVTDYIGDLDQGADVPWQRTPTDAPLDYRKLILLPRLTDLSDRDVVQWLLEVRGMTEDGSGRLGEIARNVLHNAKGEPDPTPVRVFERLKDESLWLENEEP